MAGDWKDVVLGELAAPMRNALVGGPFGSDLVSSDYSESGVPVIRGENLSSGRWIGGNFVFVPAEKAEKLAANTAGPLDIVFTQRGANHYRQVALVPMGAAAGRYVISQSQMKLTVDRRKADPLFVYYLFKSPAQQEYLQRHAIQTGVPHTNLSILRNVPLCIPPLPEQRAIAHILGTLDDKIELNRRMNETLEAIGRTLFKSWFVDFDPVRAKAERRDPGLPEPLAHLFSDSFVRSEIGEVPSRWEVRTLGDLADIQKGLSYKGNHLVERDGLPLINLGCFGSRGNFNVEKIKRYRGEYKERHLVGVGDLVIANTDVTQNRVIIGSPALVPEVGSERRFLFSHHSFAFRFKKGAERWRRYVFFSLLQPGFRQIAEGFATGTTVLALPRDAVLKHLVVLPPAQLLAAFERLIDPLISAADMFRQQSGTLCALRDELLPRLISGQVRVKNPEQFERLAIA